MMTSALQWSRTRMPPFPSAASVLMLGCYCVSCRFDTVLESGHFSKRPINLHSASAIPVVPQSSRKSFSILMANGSGSTDLPCLKVILSYWESCMFLTSRIAYLKHDVRYLVRLRNYVVPWRNLGSLSCKSLSQLNHSIYSQLYSSNKSRTRYSNRPLLLHYSMRQGRS